MNHIPVRCKNIETLMSKEGWQALINRGKRYGMIVEHGGRFPRYLWKIMFHGHHMLSRGKSIFPGLHGASTGLHIDTQSMKKSNLENPWRTLIPPSPCGTP